MLPPPMMPAKREDESWAAYLRRTSTPATASESILEPRVPAAVSWSSVAET